MSIEKINSVKNINHKAYERWNAQESRRLLAMYEEGVNVNSIAKIFNRSLTSVIIQLGKLLSEELKHNANS
jgi:Zn-dependent M32 family carboxypeptidase